MITFYCILVNEVPYMERRKRKGKGVLREWDRGAIGIVEREGAGER